MWPHGSPQPPLATEAPTCADLLDAHWNALPLSRRAHILLSLAWRLLRAPAREIASGMLVQAEGARNALRRLVRGLSDAAAALQWSITPKGRYAIADFIESLATFRAARAGWPIIALIVSLVMLRDEDRTPIRSEPGHEISVVEAARLAKRMRPPPCYFADGGVWIDDHGTLLRPGHRNYQRRYQELCSR